MIQVLIKALLSVGMRLLAAMGSEKLIEWALFKIADVIVASTKTPHDDAFLEKLKEAYEQGNGDSPS